LRDRSAPHEQEFEKDERVSNETHPGTAKLVKLEKTAGPREAVPPFLSRPLNYFPVLT
jgi:hypothetical protein